MTSYYTLVASGPIYAKVHQSGLRTSIVYGSREDNGEHGHLVLIAGSVVHNRPMPNGTIANLGITELGLIPAIGSPCASFALIQRINLGIM